MNAAKRREIFARLQAANPNPTTELEYDTPFQLLIAVLLSAQATDKSVNIATRKFFPEHGTPAAMLALGEDGLADYIKTIGLFRTKAKNAIATCRILLEQHGGEVPHARGTRSAARRGPQDRQCGAQHRVRRTHHGGGHAYIPRVQPYRHRARKNVLEVERKLEKFVPAEYMLNAHHWLILLGRYVCVARKPKCPQCGISDLCEYKPKTPA